MRQLTKNRSRQEIIRDVLASLENSNLSRTKVMYRASLSYTQLKYYEEYLQDNALITSADGDLWALTDKGKQYLQACKHADEILKAPAIAPTMAQTVASTMTTTLQSQPSVQ